LTETINIGNYSPPKYVSRNYLHFHEALSLYLHYIVMKFGCQLLVRTCFWYFCKRYTYII